MRAFTIATEDPGGWRATGVERFGSWIDSHVLYCASGYPQAAV